jgi:hypothetical protein
MEKIVSMQPHPVNNLSKYEEYMLMGERLEKPKVDCEKPIQKVDLEKPKVDLEKPILKVDLEKPIPKVDLENPIPKVSEKQKDASFFIPREKDALFWCFFVIKNGFAAYEYPGTRSFANEKELKFKLIESMRANKQTLKIKKIKNIKEDVEDELANKNKIGMKTFIALCASENINILFIHKRKCFELVFEEESPFHVIHWTENPDKYCYEMNLSKDAVNKYRTTLFRWESLEKPLKAMSAYKSDELLGMCKQLGLDEKIADLAKKTKKDLYELLLSNL